MREGWTVRTPRMRYYNRNRTLRADAGFINQIKLDSGWLVMRGRRLDIQLQLEQSAVESWRIYGSPAILEKTDRPELPL
jgi:hypothetical protein